jgi:predicted nucleic acid-binding protein
LSYIVDASVVIAALVDPGPIGSWAETILLSGPAHAPALIHVEVTNALRRLERARQLSTPEANAAFIDLRELRLELFPFDPFAERIWELRHSVTSYDAFYVALAETLDLPLATLDRRLTKASETRCRFEIPDLA